MRLDGVEAVCSFSADAEVEEVEVLSVAAAGGAETEDVDDEQ